MTKRLTGIYLLFAAASVCFAGFSADCASAATPREPGYACELVDTGLLRAAFGKGLTAEERVTEPAATFGDDSYGSGCTVILTKKRKEAAGRRQTHRSPHRIRVGSVRVTTVVAAEGVPAEKWSAATQEANEISYVTLWTSAFGGSACPMESFGQSEVHAYLLGSKELSAYAFWRHGEAGEISIGLHDRNELSSRLEHLLSRVAAGIVPEFSP